MLSPELINKIQDFVYIKPRTIQEVASHIGKNWRTADRYIEIISKEQGTLSVRTFREGTRGALKIVYWQEAEKINASEFQERLFQQIISGRNKKDFSASEIFQYIKNNKKDAEIIRYRDYGKNKNYKNFSDFLKKAKSQIFFFSGNLSFSNIGEDKKILEILEELADKGIAIKILTRVEVPGLGNIKNVLSVNNKIGKKMIEIRHCYQPLRATLIDNKVICLKDVEDPKDYAEDELKEKLNILYYIYDKEWIEWIKKIFWNLFRNSISAEKRIKDIESIRDLKI